MVKTSSTRPHGHDPPIDREKAQEGIRRLIDAVGEDPTRDGLRAPWQRRVPVALATLTEGNRAAARPTEQERHRFSAAIEWRQTNR